MPAEPSKFAVPVTFPARAIARAVVRVAAEPVVFWLPAAFTPGKLIFADPSKDTPPIVLAVASIVAVAANPDVAWLPAEFTPGKSIFAEPLKLTPPIFLAVASIVAVAALPVVLPELPEVLPVTLPSRFATNVPTA